MVEELAFPLNVLKRLGERANYFASVSARSTVLKSYKRIYIYNTRQKRRRVLCGEQKSLARWDEQRVRVTRE